MTFEPSAATIVDRRIRFSPLPGEGVRLASNRSLFLDESDFWLVDAGEVELLVIPHGEEAAGRRHPLVSLETGRAFTGLPDSRDSQLVAVARGDTQLYRISTQELRAALGDPDRMQEARPIVQSWIEDLCRILGREPSPRRCAAFVAAGDVEVEGQVHLRPRQGTAWICQDSGRSHLVGRAELALQTGRPVPLTAHAWLKVEEKARFRVLAGATRTDEQFFEHGRLELERLTARYCDLVVSERELAAAKRVRQAALAPAAALNRACQQLAAAVSSETIFARAVALPGRAEATDEDGGLYACCALIAGSLNLAAPPPPASTWTTTPGDRLDAILQDSGLRARKVVLREDWWRYDNGPLLVFTEVDDQPSALLWRAGAYHRHQPGPPARSESWTGLHPSQVDGDPSVVGRREAATLAPFGYTFYAPFPDQRLGIRDIFRFAARRSSGDLLWVIIMAVAGALLGLVPSMATGVLFNTVIPGAQRPQLYQMTIILAVCAVTGTAFNLVRGLGLLRIQVRMGTAVQAAIWDRLIRLPLPFFRPYTAGELASRAMSIQSIQQTLSGTTASAVLGGLFSLINIVMMFVYSPTLAWRGLLLIAVALAITIAGALFQLSPQRKVIRLGNKTSGLVLQLLSSISKLRVAGAEGRAFAQWAEKFALQRRLSLKIERISNWLTSFVGAFPILASAVIFWVASGLLADKDAPLRPGDFLAFGAAFSACLSSLLGMCMSAIQALEVIPLFQEAKPILEARPESGEAQADPGQLSGGIRAQGLVFRYHSDGPPVLRDVSFNIKPGELVAFVGPSGSGKSTLLRLMLGFEKTESGGIYFDGQEIGGLSLRALRRQMGVVLQSGQLMAGDIFTNIRGSTDCTLDEAWEAAALAGIAEDVQAMPMGMHTVVNEGASTLSGGQRQRILIARAIINRPSILLLDEATSALDNRTQSIVIQSLERLNVTRLVVAHRLSTIANADRIYVMEAGRIVQSGTFHELMGQEGLFRELARRQMN